VRGVLDHLISTASSLSKESEHRQCNHILEIEPPLRLTPPDIPGNARCLDDLDSKIISRIASKIQSNIEEGRNTGEASTRKRKRTPTVPKARPVRNLCWNLPKLRRGQPYEELLEEIEQLCGALRGKELIATAQYLGGCIQIAAPHLSAIKARRDNEVTGNARQERRAWRLRAEFANKIFDGIVEEWRSKAYLVFDIFAGGSSRTFGSIGVDCTSDDGLVPRFAGYCGQSTHQDC
jgi:hypothetical protein